MRVLPPKLAHICAFLPSGAKKCRLSFSLRLQESLQFFDSFRQECLDVSRSRRQDCYSPSISGCASFSLTGILQYLKSVIFRLNECLKTTKISSDLKWRFFNRWLNSVYWGILPKPFPTTNILSVMLNYNCQTQITFLCNFIAQFIWESAAAALHGPSITKSAGSHHALARCPRRRDDWY